MRSMMCWSLVIIAALPFGCIDDPGSSSDAGRTVAKDGGPPPVAVEACKGLTEGTECSFTIGGYKVNGHCGTGPEGQGSFACGPDGTPPSGTGDGGALPSTPPPAAVDACKGLTEGTACSFTIEGYMVSGRCGTGPGAQGMFACGPQGAVQ